MAYATCTYSVKPITIMGDKRVHKVLIAVSSYGTDGIPFTAALAGLAALDAIMGIAVRTKVANGPVVVVWSETSELLLALKATNSGTDATTAFDLDVTVMGS